MSLHVTVVFLLFNGCFLCVGTAGKIILDGKDLSSNPRIFESVR